MKATPGIESVPAAPPVDRFWLSELGPIPSDWRLETLKTLTDPKRTIRYGIVQPGPYDPLGRYLIRSSDYSRDWAEPSHLFRVSDEIEWKDKNARVKVGDLLITIVGTKCGHVAIVPDWLDGSNITQATARVALLSGKASSSYCAHFLQSRYGTSQVANYTKGGAHPGLSCADIKKFMIPLPPTLEEQEAIAEAISKANALVASVESLLAKKQAIKHATMHELFSGNVRLAGFNEPWTDALLGEVAPLRRGFDLSEKKLDRGRYPVVYSSGILTSNSSYKAKGPGVITGRSGTLGSVMYVEGNFWPHNTTLWVTDFKGNDPKFIFYLFNNLDFRRFSAGSSVPTLSRKDAHAHRVTIPGTLDEQLAIARVLTALDNEIKSLKKRLTKLQNLVTGMSHGLLTGKLRLSRS